jgi:hypothetical protein
MIQSSKIIKAHQIDLHIQDVRKKLAQAVNSIVSKIGDAENKRIVATRLES